MRRARTSATRASCGSTPTSCSSRSAKAPGEFAGAGAQPGPRHRLRGRSHGVRRRGRRAVRARRRRAARRDAGRPRAVRAARAHLRRDRHHRADPVRADRPAARLAPPRDGVRAADADGQGADVGAVRRRQDARLARDDGDRAGRRRGARAGAGRVRRLERELAAALRRRDARGDGGARRAQPGHRRDAVPADGRDGAGRDPGGARAADRRAARGRRLRPAGASRRAGPARLVPVPHRHAVGLARVRRAGVGDRTARLGPAGAPVRAAVAVGRRRAHVEPAAGCAGRVRGAEHDAAGVPGGRELPPPLPRAGWSPGWSRATRSTCSTSRRCGSCGRSSRRSR